MPPDLPAPTDGRDPATEPATPMHWQELFGTFAAVALAAVAWTLVEDLLVRRRSRHSTMAAALPDAGLPDAGHDLARSLALGAVMGSGAMVSLVLAVPVVPGVHLDLRAPCLALAGFFGGGPAALLAGGIALAVRLPLGGSGLAGGTLCILAAMAIGAAGHRLVRGRAPRPLDLLGLGAVTGVAAPLPWLTLPAPLMAGMTGEVVPFMVLNLVGTAAAGLMLLQDRRRREAADTNAMYRAVIEALPDSLNAKNAGGRFLLANPATARLVRAPGVASLIGRTDADFHPADIAARYRADEAAAMAADGPTLLEQPFRRTDGSTGWLSTLKTPLRTPSGALLGLVTHNRDITEAKRLDADLARTKRLLDAALAHMADGLALYGEDGTLLLCNARYPALFPLTADLRRPGIHLGTILRAAVERGEERPLDRPLDEWVAECVANLYTGHDYLLRFADGRCVELQTRPVEGVGSLVVGTDVTERLKAEERRAAAEAEYRALFENAVTGIYRSSPEGRLLRANPALVRLHGYGAEAELIEAVRDLGTEWYVEPGRRAEFLRLLAEDGRVNDFVSQVHRHRTRERIWISEAAWAVRNARGEVAYYEGTVVEISARKRAEAVVVASEARYRLLADNAADLVVLLGPDGTLRFVSPACRDLIGVEPDELIAEAALSLVHVADRPSVALVLSGAQAGATVAGLEFRLLRRDGTALWVEANGRWLEREGGCVLSIRDVSARKQAQDELAEAMRRLEALAATDGLTGLASRRVFEATLEREAARCSRERTPLSLLLIDVDRFKSYNDTYGHPAGDDCLAQVAAALRATLRRPGDLAARYGGEEMVAVLPGTDAPGVAVLAEAYRAAVRRLGLAHAGSEHGLVTVSVGVATLLPGAGDAGDASTARGLLTRADEALYRAKREGRDKVVAAQAA